jgi:large subunit ribosomal protein L7/L12
VAVLPPPFGLGAAVRSRLLRAAGGVEGTRDVVIVNAGPKKIEAIKALMTVCGIGMKDAKDLIESVPRTVREGVSEQESARIKEVLERAGARVELRPGRAGGG